MAEQTCAAEIHRGRYIGDTPIVQVEMCGLPIRSENGEWVHVDERRFPDHPMPIDEYHGHTAQPAAAVKGEAE